MKTAKWFLIAAIIAVSAVVVQPAPAAAQDGPVTFNIGVGVMFPQGDAADRFDPGVTVPIGLTFNFNENLGLQGEYWYSWMGGPDTTVFAEDGSPTLIESNHSMHVGNANIVFKGRGSGAVGGYGLGGIGVYHRSVELTTPGVGLISVCDPFWFVCFPVAVPVDQVIGSRSSTDFGINFGGGITFSRFYVELRYHYIWGPEFDIPAAFGGGTRSASGYYIPLNFGFRF